MYSYCQLDLFKAYGEHLSQQRGDDLVSFGPEEITAHYDKTYLDIIFYPRLQKQAEKQKGKQSQASPGVLNKSKMLK